MERRPWNMEHETRYAARGTGIWVVERVTRNMEHRTSKVESMFGTSQKWFTLLKITSNLNALLNIRSV